MELEEQYMQQLTPNQKQAYTIAKRNLGSSFNLSRSIGFLDWKKSLPAPTIVIGTSSNSPHS